MIYLYYIFGCIFRWVARDIGGSDPERMAPVKVEEYVLNAFSNSGLKIEVISDLQKLKKDFPLFAAVNRAANGKRFCRIEA